MKITSIKFFPVLSQLPTQKEPSLKWMVPQPTCSRKTAAYEIMGRNAITCHPPRTQEKVRKIYESQS